MIVAIDGPSGAGKSTVAWAVAGALGFEYLDTGAMYRCVGLLALRRPDEAPGVIAADAAIALDGGRVLLDGEEVTGVIRSAEVSEAASRVAADPDVRRALVAGQRVLMADGDWVAEGRDIGTVVAPDAAVKVFLVASAAERARRRARELGSDPERVLVEQARRDERDAGRAESPLVPAPDAVLLDTDGVSPEEVTARIVALAREAGA
jgi:cytidylate kinase